MTGDSPLGRQTEYPDEYSPELLFAIARAENRTALGLSSELPFGGVDIWNAWEMTWLAGTGQPHVATAEIRVPADSPNILESKSLKLYLNSFSMSRYDSIEELQRAIAVDLSKSAGSEVSVAIHEPNSTEGAPTATLPGICIDDLEVSCDSREVDSKLLEADATDVVRESLHSHILRSLCPVTSQPDSGSLLISYEGPRIDRASLLRYIASFRQHMDFHEACVERMFMEISARCGISRLSVYARYQRRGGIDINPFRSNFESDVNNSRLWRQ
jgi:7-cyano-7-deazaguanine reductase